MRVGGPPTPIKRSQKLLDSVQMPKSLQCFVVLLLSGLCCRADLTLRYSQDLKMGTGLPAAATAAVASQLQNLGKERRIRIKDDRSVSDIGGLVGISDNAKGEITLLNAATKQYATLALPELLTAMQSAVAVPAAVQQMLQNLQFEVQSTKTGQTGMVAGFRAEERLTTMTASMNAAGAAGAALLRLEMHTWIASPEEVSRIPAVREYAAYAQTALRAFDPAEQIQKLFAQIPGFADKLRGAVAELSADPGSLTVQTQQKMYMPIMAQLAQLQPTAGAPATDPNAPIMEMTSRLIEISSDPIDDSVFTVPPDYRKASPEEILKALKPATAAPPAPTAVREQPDSKPIESIVRLPPRVPGGVSPPMVIYKQEPIYTEEARRAKVAGTVALSVIVDTEGNARNIQVAHSLDPGLDQKAMEAVSNWKFKPGQKDGQPVNVRATIEVNFRLIDRPDDPKAPQ